MHLILASNRVECCPEWFQMQAATAKEAEQRLVLEIASVRNNAAISANEAAQCQGELKGLRLQVQEQMALIKAMSISNTEVVVKDSGNG